MGAINYKRIGGNEEGKIKFRAIFSDGAGEEDAFLVKQFSRTGFRLGAVARPTTVEDFYLVDTAVNVGDAVLPLIVEYEATTYTPKTVAGTFPIAVPTADNGNVDVSVSIGTGPEVVSTVIRFTILDEEITAAAIQTTGTATDNPATVEVEVEGETVTLTLAYDTDPAVPVTNSVGKIASYRVGTFDGAGKQYVLGGVQEGDVGVIPVLD